MLQSAGYMSLRERNSTYATQWAQQRSVQIKHAQQLRRETNKHELDILSKECTFKPKFLTKLKSKTGSSGVGNGVSEYSQAFMNNFHFNFANQKRCRNKKNSLTKDGKQTENRIKLGEIIAYKNQTSSIRQKQKENYNSNSLLNIEHSISEEFASFSSIKTERSRTKNSLTRYGSTPSLDRLSSLKSKLNNKRHRRYFSAGVRKSSDKGAKYETHKDILEKRFKDMNNFATMSSANKCPDLKDQKKIALLVPKNQKFDIPEYVSNQELRQCNFCLRKFNTEKIKRHENICKQRVENNERDIFDVRKQRLGEFRLSSADNQILKAGLTKAVEPLRTNWKIKSQQLRNVASGCHQDEQGKVSLEFGYKECPHCFRTFNEKAAERHIPKCKDLRHKPSRLLKGEGRNASKSASLKPK